MSGLTSRTVAAQDADAAPIPITRVAALLEERVVSGAYAPGVRLPSERDLAAQFGVGRPAIREVLRGLQQKGLVEVQAGRGTFVREVRLTDPHATADLALRRGKITARELIVARTMLECETAALAAINRTDEEAERMARILRAFEASPDTGAGSALDLAFHEAVAVASRNQVLQIMFGSIRTLIHGVVLRSLTDRNVRNSGIPIHAEVLAAIVSQDPDAARAAMARHMRAAEPHYGRDLDEPLVDVLSRRALDSQPSVAELLRKASRDIEEE